MVEIKVDQHQKGNSKMALSQNVKFPIFIWCNEEGWKKKSLWVAIGLLDVIGK